MRLISCYIENFGCLHDLKVSFDPGESVIYEENGWGKSTLAAFIRIMFFGFENEGKRDRIENERSRFLPWQKGIYGGRIIFEAADRTYRLERIFDSRRSSGDTCELYDQETNLLQNLSGMEIPGGHLGPFLFGIDSGSFQRTVYIGQQDCASADATAEINAKIGNLSDQTADMGNYESVQLKLEKEMHRLGPNRKTGQISRMKADADELEGELRNAEVRKHSLDHLEAGILQLRRKRRELLDEQKQISRKIQKLGMNRERELQVEKYRNLKKAEEEAEEKLRREQEGLSETLPSVEKIDEMIDKVRSGEKLRDSLEYRREKAEMLRIMAAAQAHPEEPDRAVPPLLPIIGAVLFLAGMVLLLASMVIPGVLSTAGSLAAFGFWFYKRKNEQPENENEKVEIDAYQAAEKKYYQQMSEADADERSADRIQREVGNFLAEIGRNEIPDTFEELEKALQEIKRKIQNIRIFRIEYQKKSEERKKYIEEHTPEEMRSIISEVENSVFRDTILYDPSHQSMQELTEQLEQIQETLEEISSRLPDQEGQAESLVQQLEQMEQSESQLQEIRSEIREMQHQYDVISRTRDYLEQAKVNFTSRYMQPIRESFNRYYSMITGEAYNAFELDAELKIRIREQGALRETGSLSEGSRDLVGLCRRMAMIDAMYEKEKPFLIFDDPFVNLDDRRLAGALRFLDRIAEEYQILYFTCSESRIPED